jgi:hypothetical protein
MLEDLDRGAHLDPRAPAVEDAGKLVREKKPSFVSYEDWKKLDALEVKRAEGTDRPRIKFTSVEAMLQALGRRT